jgi:beta-lactamase regulating signal transducer with metallopeptidase domain
MVVAMPADTNFMVARLTDIAAAWLLTYLVHSTLILLAAWIVTSRRRMADAARDILWKSALVGGIVTASIQTAVAHEPLGGQLSLAATTAPSATPSMRVTVQQDGSGLAPRFLVTRPKGTHWTSTLAVLWLTTAGLGLLWLTFGHARTLRVLGGRTSLDGTPIGDRMRELLSRTGVRKPVHLTCSAKIASPLALPGGEVCVPRRALMGLEPMEQDSMLAHEIAHLVRRDPQWLVAARVIEAVLFVQPLNRLARIRMQEAAEYLCDDWAVARTSHPVTLAKCLAAVAEWVGRAPRLDAPRLHPLSAMVEGSGSPLVRRVGRILSERTAPRARDGRTAFGVSACALVALAAVAPRISVANAALSNRITFVRAVVDGIGVSPLRDSIFVFRGGPRRRVVIDSLVRQQTTGPAAGPRVRSSDVLYRRVSVEASDGDSVESGRVWTRRLPAPAGATVGGTLIPLPEVERESLIVVERRGDR